MGKTVKGEGRNIGDWVTAGARQPSLAFLLLCTLLKALDFVKALDSGDLNELLKVNV